MPRKKKSSDASAKSSKPITKAAFIRMHPTKKAAEVVELAKAQGIKLSVPHVYVVRTKENAKKSKKPGGSAKGGGKKGSAAKGAKRSNGALHANYDYEKRVRDIIFHVGFDGLKTMIDRIHVELAS